MAIIIGTAAGETLTGSDSSDELYGLDGDDLLEGLGGDDRLEGGAGADRMAGGAGDDVYIVEHSGDWVVEEKEAGFDEVRTELAFYLLPAHVEALAGLSSAGQYLGGNDLGNLIVGGAGADTIRGEGGDDVIVHSAGGDGVDGGWGDDLYVLPGAQADYEITRNGAVRIRDLVGGGPDLFLTDVESIRFEADDLTVAVASLFDRHGADGDDTLSGDDSDNHLFGYGGADLILAFGGNDRLDGGGGADTLVGGAGSDLYIVDEAGDAIVEEADAGYDVVWSWADSYAMGAHVEELISLNPGDVTILANAAANYIVTDAGDDWIEGFGGHDHIDGGQGADTMIGGAGNDYYWLDDEGDAVVEAYGGGTDRIEVNIASYVLPAHVEQAILAWDLEQSLTGNSLANTIFMAPGAKTVDGGAGSDTVIYEAEPEAVIVDLATGANGGGAADDILTAVENVTGTWNDDELYGTAGANVLNGGFGADLLVGRAGNDVYHVDEVGDVVVEQAGEGSDEVRARLDYALPDHVERLFYVGGDDFIGTGNALNNDIGGGPGGDSLFGGDGHDMLSGGGGDDALYGEAGHDTLSGGPGADVLAGGEGNDVYVVDNAADDVLELAGEGTDRIYVSFAAYALPDEVENLSFNGSGAFHGTGNALDNLIAGGGAADTLEGGAGADELRGGGGSDTLVGGDGDDLIVGGGGCDTLAGGAGADQFRIGAFESGSGASADRILDFAPGEDVIDLSGMDADSATAGDQAFTFVGAAAFSGAAGELRYAFDGTDTWLQGDTNGDGFADFEIVLSGEVTPLTGDFLL
jgi:Ca2+-binding RTX toxin-like protein